MRASGEAATTIVACCHACRIEPVEETSSNIKDAHIGFLDNEQLSTFRHILNANCI